MRGQRRALAQGKRRIIVIEDLNQHIHYKTIIWSGKNAVYQISHPIKTDKGLLLHPKEIKRGWWKDNNTTALEILKLEASGGEYWRDPNKKPSEFESTRARSRLRPGDEDFDDGVPHNWSGNPEAGEAVAYKPDNKHPESGDGEYVDDTRTHPESGDGEYLEN